MCRCLIVILVLLGAFRLASQPVAWRHNGKWGVKEGPREVIPAIYDTVFGYDATARVCMACHKVKSASKSQFIKITSVSWSCNYFDRLGKRLLIRNRAGDTCGVFSLAGNSVEQYMSEKEAFAVSAKSKKFLVGKDFRQLTKRGYHNISLSPEPMFYVAESRNDAEAVLTGVVNTNEEQVVPYSYTSVRFNPFDSLIIACSAGLTGSTDDVFDYSGRRIASYAKHVDQATRNFIIHKIFEPSEFYLILDLASQKETRLNADEVHLYSSDDIKIRVRSEWFLYNMRTSQKRPLKQT